MTLLNAALYDLTQETQGAFFVAGLKAYQRSLEKPEDPPPALLQLQRGYAESPGWLLAQAAEFDPQPLSVEKLRRRAVWSSERLLMAILEMMTVERWLDRAGEAYQLTDAGRELMRQRLGRIEKIVSCTEPLPLPDLQRLESLLRRILDASLESPTPPGAWCLAHSRSRAPSGDAHVMAKISAHCTDLNAFRDDSHMAAVYVYHVPAYAWECFSMIWTEEANTPEAAFEARYYRGYSRGEFQGAFVELVERGWIKNVDGVYRVTPQGKAIRETAERLTDEYFFQPWSVLTETEITETEGSLIALRDASNALAAEGS